MKMQPSGPLSGGREGDLFSAAPQRPNEETPTALKTCREARGIWGNEVGATNPRIRAPSERGSGQAEPEEGEKGCVRGRDGERAPLS